MEGEPDELLRLAEEMEQTLLALRHDGAARIVRALRLELAGRDAARRVATAGRELVVEAQRHARERGAAEDDLDLDDDLWADLVAAVAAWAPAETARPPRSRNRFEKVEEIAR